IQGEDLLVVAECGIGKRTKITDFSLQNRGGKGAKCYKIMEKTGYVVGAVAVNDDDEIMMITTAGIIIRMKASGISQYGRVTSGVKLVNLDKDVFVASVARVVEDKSLYTDEELAKMTEEGTAEDNDDGGES
ncbi:MAG: DNA gyrase subunit A, partial [Lachnospiraceae bacterium]|nr:DNA gyrase subunit A [Lachnospiraceae bacterium]